MTTRCQGRDEMLGILVSCIGAAAILAFISPQLLFGPYGLVLGSGAALAIVLAIFFHLRQGGSLVGACIHILLTGGLTAGSMYGIWWYFFIHLASQPNLLSFGPIAPTTFNPPAGISQTHPTVSAAVSTDGRLSTAPLTASPVPTCGTATVHEVDALALRAEPTRGSQQRTAIERGNRVELLCEPIVHADDREWYKVRYGTIEGWMSARYLHVQQP
jgi:hypothetical protein